MKIPGNVYIAPEKITQYLLKKREEDDKSNFLAGAGYSLNSADLLEIEIRLQLEKYEAVLYDQTEYGDKYQIYGELIGVNGVSLKVITIWMHETTSDLWKFITLIPDRRTRS